MKMMSVLHLLPTYSLTPSLLIMEASLTMASLAVETSHEAAKSTDSPTPQNSVLYKKKTI